MKHSLVITLGLDMGRQAAVICQNYLNTHFHILIQKSTKTNKYWMKINLNLSLLSYRLITREIAMIIETLSRICGQWRILETLGLVSGEWSLNNGPIACEASVSSWGRGGQRSKHSTWKLDLNPEIEFVLEMPAVTQQPIKTRLISSHHQLFFLH